MPRGGRTKVRILSRDVNLTGLRDDVGRGYSIDGRGVSCPDGRVLFPHSPPQLCMKQGVFYLVSGGRSYLGELLASLRSLRKWEPDLPVTVMSRFDLPAGLSHCRSMPLPADEHPLKLKVLSLRHSPYEQTLFLDTDTTILGKVSPLFAENAAAEFAAANSHEADWSARPPKFLAMVKPGDYNTGVLVYKKTPAVMDLLGRWEQAVMEQDPSGMWAGHFCDQYHFNRLVAEGVLDSTGVAFRELDNVIWNARGGMIAEIRRTGRIGEVRILHHRTRRMKLEKLLYAYTDATTVKELGRKLARRISSGG